LTVSYQHSQAENPVAVPLPVGIPDGTEAFIALLENSRVERLFDATTQQDRVFREEEQKPMTELFKDFSHGASLQGGSPKNSNRFGFGIESTSRHRRGRNKRGRNQVSNYETVEPE
jgi:hypothetical protein